MWKKSEFYIFGWFPGLQNLYFFKENLLCSKFGNYFPAEIIPKSPLFLDFLKVFHMVWKNQESGETWLVGFWVCRCWKMQSISANKVFLGFLCIFEPPLWIYNIPWNIKFFLSNVATSYILQQFGKFLSNSEMDHVQACIIWSFR